jgi:hypothetical protein
MDNQVAARDGTAGERARPFTLVYILGSGHCGSTLLSLLLNAHSRMLALGEIDDLADFTIPTHEGATKNIELDSPLWRRVAERWEAATGRPLRDIDIRHPASRDAVRWSEARVARWAEENALLFSLVAEESQAEILVDSTKFPQRLYLLRRAGCFRLKVVHLQRDGRAVLHSYRRRGRTFRQGWSRWARSSVAAGVLRRRVPAGDWITVHYEDLVESPSDTLRRICAFLGVEFEPGMLAYRSRPSEAIGGNRMRYDRTETIVLDEEWKTALSRADRVRFALAGGILNRLQGY